MPTVDERLDELAAAVLAGPKYRAIQPELARRIGAQELAKGRSLKEAIKETRAKLHQVGAAYQETPPDYAQLTAGLAASAPEMQDTSLRSFCRMAMQYHASTRERLPVLEEFYIGIAERVGPLQSVLDLACGLNPLALPWMGLLTGGEYTAWDIYTDLADFLNRFFIYLGVSGRAELVDLSVSVPAKPVQLALLLKTLPCLEQLDKQIGPRLLDAIQAEHLVVSFPSRSLGGHHKGMAQHYSQHFESLLQGCNWQLAERWETGSELVYWLRRG